MSVLVTVAELAGRGVPPPGVRLLDVRWRLGGPPGREEYRAGHLPGAVYVDLDTELSAPSSPGAGRHPLPHPGDLDGALRSWGVDRGEPVVVYDDVGGLSAARAWWLLRWAGLADVRILDGGLGAWRDAELPLATGDGSTRSGEAAERGDGGGATGTSGSGGQGGVAGSVPGEADGAGRVDPDRAGGGMPTVTADEVAAFVADGGLLLDARPAERYRGSDNPYDPRPGHIPASVSAPAADDLGPDGRFRTPSELAEQFAALGAVPGRPVAVYCGSGVTATHVVAALELAGVEGVALYPGSYSQWAADPSRPVATS
ncbi:MAG: sulfurtransferase [Kineosporiaceae bacterium]